MRDTNAVLEEYERLAPRYDRRWARYVDASVRETLKRLELARDARVLDVGCGTGVLLESLSRAAPGVRLAGIDPSQAMLAVARERIGGAARLVRARAEALPFTDAAFDAAVSSSVLHFVREPRAALAEIARVLRPGGCLVLTDWCRDFWTVRGLDLWLRTSNAAHVRTYGADECGLMLGDAGFAHVCVERYRIDWFWGLMTASGRRPGAE